MTVSHLPPPPDDDGVDLGPADPDAERTCIGAILTGDRHALDDVTSTITGGDYADPRHEAIHDAATHLYARGEPVDPIAVTDRLRRTKDLRRAGGAAYLHELRSAVVVTTGAGYYADIVRDLAQRRRVAQQARSLLAKALTPGDTPMGDILERHRADLDTVVRGIPGVEDDTPHPWAPIELDEILADPAASAVTAEVGYRRDGHALLYPGAIHSVSGEPGSGKTWLGLIVAAQELEEGRPVLLVDFEDRAQTAVQRLHALGVSMDALRDGLRYIRPSVALDGAGWRHLAEAAYGCRLAIIDGVTEAMTLHGLSLMDNEDVARFIALLPRRLADLGPAVLQVDHVVKNSEARGRYAIGGQHKLAALDGVAYKMMTLTSFGKGNHGRAKLVIDKDRHGDVGPNGSTAAEVHLDAKDPAATFGWIDVPETSTDAQGNFRPTVLMRRVSDAVHRSPGLTKNGIRGVVKGSNTGIDIAIDTLVREGYLTTSARPQGGDFYYPVTPYQEDGK